MVFTTHFRLHSQTTWLFESVSHRPGSLVKDGVLTLYDVLFQGTYTKALPENTSRNYNSPRGTLGDFKFELFPLHSPLLGESLLVSFPPLIDMLKFSGWSCLIWDLDYETPKLGVGRSPTSCEMVVLFGGKSYAFKFLCDRCNAQLQREVHKRPNHA